MATIDIAMTSWPNCPQRVEYMAEVLKSLKENVTASGHDMRCHCSIETERDPKHTWCGDALADLLDAHNIWWEWRDKPANLGGNMNDALAMGHGEFVYLQQDVCLLTEPLVLSPCAYLLSTLKQLDIVRYSWPEDPRMVPTFNGNLDGWRKIAMRGTWPYGDDPHLRRRDFMEKWGWYYDKGKHGTASIELTATLRKGNANIVAADKVYYQNIGYASAVLNDVRDGGNRRYE